MTSLPHVSRETASGAGGTLPANVQRRIRDLVAEYGRQAEVEGREVEGRLGALLEHLAAAGGRAPTTVTAPAAAVDVHVADALAALALDPVREARCIADIGAGAGVPGLVLAAALEGAGAQVRLLDSQQAKCSFVAAAITRMGLRNARVVWSRVESWTEGAGAHDLVTARALAAQPVVLEYAAPLLGVGGRLVDWRGARRPEEEEAAARAAPELGMRPVEVRRVLPFAAAEDRHLHVFEKVAATPAGFPRRPGAALKNPLGAART